MIVKRVYQNNKGGNKKMAYRDDINYAMMNQVQRFREEPLSTEEQEEIVNDVMAFCIIEIRKFCGEDIFERKAEELEEKGINKARAKIKMSLENKDDKKLS